MPAQKNLPLSKPTSNATSDLTKQENKIVENNIETMHELYQHLNNKFNIVLANNTEFKLIKINNFIQKDSQKKYTEFGYMGNENPIYITSHSFNHTQISLDKNEMTYVDGLQAIKTYSKNNELFDNTNEAYIVIPLFNKNSFGLGIAKVKKYTDEMDFQLMTLFTNAISPFSSFYYKNEIANACKKQEMQYQGTFYAKNSLAMSNSLNTGADILKKITDVIDGKLNLALAFDQFKSQKEKKQNEEKLINKTYDIFSFPLGVIALLGGGAFLGLALTIIPTVLPLAILFFSVGIGTLLLAYPLIYSMGKSLFPGSGIDVTQLYKRLTATADSEQKQPPQIISTNNKILHSTIVQNPTVNNTENHTEKKSEEKKLSLN
ncbi:MAG: hypothetical protein LEGION0398_MBIBDBAK_00074 [Legionellaceae bacterium]